MARAHDAALQVLAEFDLEGIHCLLVPADALQGDTLPGDTLPGDALPGDALPVGSRPINVMPDGDGHAARDVCGSRPHGARPLCGFELDGRRYVLYARTGPGRTQEADSDDPLSALTAREQQIVRLVCLGMVNKQIADKLRISEYTVKTYLKQIFCKLNVHSRSAMVYRCTTWSAARPLRDG